MQVATDELVEFRCPTPGCGRLLFKVSKVDGAEVEAKCPRCKETVVAQLATPSKG